MVLGDEIFYNIAHHHAVLRDTICISQIYPKIITQSSQVAGGTECMIRPYRIHYKLYLKIITQPSQVAGITECMIRPYRIH